MIKKFIFLFILIVIILPVVLIGFVVFDILFESSHPKYKFSPEIVITDETMSLIHI